MIRKFSKIMTILAKPAATHRVVTVRASLISNVQDPQVLKVRKTSSKSSCSGVNPNTYSSSGVAPNICSGVTPNTCFGVTLNTYRRRCHRQKIQDGRVVALVFVDVVVVAAVVVVVARACRL